MDFELPGAGSVLEREAVRRLVEVGRKGLGGEELIAALQKAVAAPEEAARGALAALERRGEAAEVDGRWLAVAATDWAVGFVETQEGGDAVIRPRGGGQAELYVPRRRLRGALDGDTVLAEPVVSRRRHRERDLEEAVVRKVLHHGLPRLVGTLELDEVGRRWLVPFDPRVALDVEVLDAEELMEDQYVVVEVERGGAPTRHPRGRVVEVLGNPHTPGVDVKVVLRHYGIPEEFPPGALAAAAALPEDPLPAHWEGRQDLRRHTVVTIDGETARDFDDAVSVERLAGGAFRLGVHIADVSHYVAEGSELDAEAYRRSTSVYYPDRAVPMLPEALSNGLCSLRPGVPRLTVSAFLEIGADGRVLAHRFAETVIRSHRRLTYAEVRRLLEEPVAGDEAEYGPLLEHLAAMRDLMEILYRERRRRGSIDFDLPTGDVVLDTDGYTVGIRPGERNVAHRIIEELMIAANEAVARELEASGVPALFRVHDSPPVPALEELREVLRSLGLKLKGDLRDLAPSALQEVLERVEGRPEESFVSTMVLRTLARALYSPECRGHYALAARHYLHFTSPIRRYPDLVVHRALKGLLAGRGDGGSASLASRLDAMAEHASNNERRAEHSERDLLQWKKVRFLADRVGERFSGRITGVQPFGFFVQLDDLYVDGLIPIRALTDDYYVYEADSHRLVGDRQGRVFQLADEIEVVLTGVSERHRGLDLKPSVLSEPRRRRRGQNRREKGRGKHRRRR